MFDKIALSNGCSVLLLSIFTQNQKAKAIRALLSGGAGGIRISASGVQIARNPGDWDKKSIGNYKLMPSDDGYYSFVERRDFGMCHVLFISHMEGFMPVVDDTAIWSELKSDRYTTPILREWMPYIKEQLEGRGLLKMCWQYRSQCATITATTEHLDDIVSTGLKSRRIEIPDTRISDAEFTINPPLALESSDGDLPRI